MNKAKVKIEQAKLADVLMNFCFAAFIFLAFGFLNDKISAQTGGTYDLSHSVIAAGGGSNSTGGTFRVDGTVGQTAAGTVSTGSVYSLRGGFWAFDSLAPTAAETSISGRVLSADRRGIRNVRVTLTGADGVTRITISSAFGYFKFDDVPTGGVCLISVSAKHYQFSQPTQIFSILEEVNGLEFVAVQ